MNPIKFPEQNSTLGKGQPEFRPLPINVQVVDEERGIKRYTGKYEFSELELQQVIATKSFFFSQFGNCFHPILPQVESPFESFPIQYERTENGLYNITCKTDSGLEVNIMGLLPAECIPALLNRFNNLTPENIYFIEKPSLAIDEDGKSKDL